jgi:hypothetical protein
VPASAPAAGASGAAAPPPPAFTPPAPSSAEATAAPGALPSSESDRLQEFEPEALINDGNDGSDEQRDDRTTWKDRRLDLLAHAGLGFPRFGGSHEQANSDLYAFAGVLSVSYALAMGPGALEVGVATSYVPIASRNGATGKNFLSHLIGGFATTGFSFVLEKSLSVGPSLALGVVWWSGLENGNIFTSSGQGIRGANAMPSLRLGLPLLWHAGSNLLLGIEPAWSYSKTTNDDLARKTPDLRGLAMSVVLGFSL